MIQKHVQLANRVAYKIEYVYNVQHQLLNKKSFGVCVKYDDLYANHSDIPKDVVMANVGVWFDNKWFSTLFNKFTKVTITKSELNSDQYVYFKFEN